MKRVLSVFAFLVLAGTGLLRGIPWTDGFPHEKHARMFPLCTGCHEGIEAGDASRFYPAATSCQGCHNGTDQPRVNWRSPRDYASTLKFSHPSHEAKQSLDCNECHTASGAERMAVQRAVTGRCFACHAHPARNHFADAQCQQCHIPLARTRLASTRVEALPQPPSHEQPRFLERVHGELAKSDRARCEVCHTRERCASCHVDAARNAAVQAMLPAGAQLRLPRLKARYFVPESHGSPRWVEQHGDRSRRDINECSACHTRESCRACHAAGAPRVIRSLPARSETEAPGVDAVRRRPASHEAPFFDQNHGPLAAARKQSCSGCHARTECEQCHSSPTATRRQSALPAPQSLTVKSSVQQDTGQRRPARRMAAGYHPANFLQRHASAAYNRNLECANCHDASRFCRDCHDRSGMRTVGRLQAGFHDAQPVFLLNHGKPARQSLESCASCHKQTDCMQCHSALGAFRVNPHGPGFDARRVQQRNARLCFACHLTDPMERNK